MVGRDDGAVVVLEVLVDHGPAPPHGQPRHAPPGRGARTRGLSLGLRVVVGLHIKVGFRMTMVYGIERFINFYSENIEMSCSGSLNLNGENIIIIPHF